MSNISVLALSHSSLLFAPIFTSSHSLVAQTEYSLELMFNNTYRDAERMREKQTKKQDGGEPANQAVK